MEYLLNFFSPISLDLQAYCDDLPDTSLGQYIKKYTIDKEPSLLKKSIAIIGVPGSEDALDGQTESVLDDMRRQLYVLHIGNWESTVVDMGNLMLNDETDTSVIIKEVLVELIKNDITVIVLGGTQALTYDIYRSYDDLEQKVNLCVADPCFDLGALSDKLSEHSYLTHIIMDKPDNLMNFYNLGYQTYLNTQEEIELLDKMYFEAYRLGVLKEDMTMVEPVLRDTDVFSIDLSVLKASELPMASLPHVNGFTAGELCQMSRYAGVSDSLAVMGIFDEVLLSEKNPYTSQVVAQMLWYFIDGFHFRIKEFPDEQLSNFKKYNVLVESETITFYKSNMTNRWWMEINLKINNNLTRRTLVPCSYKDYLSAIDKEIPERWYVNRKKINY
ncbi:MAG: hypothetical protein CR968_02940 [Flavobacteriia bacterium]|nr:MAG: hypothetical protein CR968_02940 [Flavobacteriia bacterium]